MWPDAVRMSTKTCRLGGGFRSHWKAARATTSCRSDDVLELTVFWVSRVQEGRKFLLCHRRANPRSRRHQDADGHARRHDARYVDAPKPLASVTRMCQASHTVFLKSSGRSSLTKSTGEVHCFRDDDDMLDVWVLPPGYHGEDCKLDFWQASAANTQLVKRPHDNCRNISGDGERVRMTQRTYS